MRDSPKSYQCEDKISWIEYILEEEQKNIFNGKGCEP
jgi:hypothetical protein